MNLWPSPARRASTLTGVLSALSVLGACTAISDLDRFEQASGGTGGSGGGGAAAGAADAGAADAGGDAGEPSLGCPNPRTLCLRMNEFDAHRDEVVAIDLVKGSNLRAHVVLVPLGDGEQTTADVVLPLAIPESEVPDPGAEHPLHLEIWADDNKNGVYDPEDDHDWRVPLPEDGNVVFVHNTLFEDLLPRPSPSGGDLVVHFTNMDIHMGKMLEVMAIEEATGRTVGMHRVGAISSPNFDVEVRGVIDPGGVVYRVEFYADANGNRTYDDPPTDHAWVRFVESNADGAEIPFDHGTVFDELDYQFDFEE